MRHALACFLLAFAFSSPAFPVPPAQAGVQTYDGLVHAIREARAASRGRLEQAVEKEKVREAWEIGKLIDTHVLYRKERADYGEQVLVKLAKDLETSETELRYMLQFARTYPSHRPADELSWSHYQALLSLNDPKERETVAREAVRKGWTRDQVREEVRRRQAARKPTGEKIPEVVLTAAPGKVGVYRVIRAKAGPFAGELGLDLGFASYLSLEVFSSRRWPQDGARFFGAGRGAAAFKEGDLVALRKGKLKSFKGSNEDRYTYPAYVSEIVDGDTFKAVIDLGFNIVTEQKLRLRGLDAPEIESAEGREAKAFLESVIARPPTRLRVRQSREAGEAIFAPVLIKTVKPDKYDRYLADLWVGETYINQELIDKGLAVRVTE